MSILQISKNAENEPSLAIGGVDTAENAPLKSSSILQVLRGGRASTARLCPILLTFETGVARDFGSDFSKNSANFLDFSEISQSYNHSYQNP